jgi:hypothetical protein
VSRWVVSRWLGPESRSAHPNDAINSPTRTGSGAPFMTGEGLAGFFPL